jgi:hypothetical protein
MESFTSSMKFASGAAAATVGKQTNDPMRRINLRKFARNAPDV